VEGRERAFATPRLGRNVALGFLLAVLLFLTADPMGMLVYGSLPSPPQGVAGTWTLDGYRAMPSRSNAVVLLNTIGLFLVKTCLAMVVALFLAWIVANRHAVPVAPAGMRRAGRSC
jgi:iron(III) transport system permease protein